MANTYVVYTGDGSTTNFSIPFTYLDEDYVKVSVDGEDTEFTFLSEYVAQLAEAPEDGAAVRVYRETKRDGLIVTIPSSGNITGADINNQSKQALNVAEEGTEALTAAMGEGSDGNLDAAERQIKNVTDPTEDQDAATKKYVDDENDAQTAAINSAVSAASASASTATTKASEASSSASAAATSESNASDYADQAQQWANEDEDVEVSGGEYSAKHYAAKAAESAASTTPVADQIHSATAGAIDDADELGFTNADGSWGLLKITWANVKATLKTYFDTLYSAVGHTHSNATTGADGFMSAADKTALDAVGSMANRDVTVSTSDPSGGADGDFWFKV